MNKIDINKWIKKDLWVLWEGIFLLLGVEPDRSRFLRNEQDRYGAPGFWNKFDEIADIAKASINRNLLRVFSRPPNLLFCEIIPSTFLEWAQKKELLNDQLESIFQRRNEYEHSIEQDAHHVEVSGNEIEKKLRPSQKAKIACQAIARVLWDSHPTMTIEEMKVHPAILKHGYGSYYSGKNTLRDWLSEVDPRPKNKKTGRPSSPK
ncbi:TPA: hypothetical protein P5J75_001958 [Legionella pneumophila]|uniref:hypothetical protein n=1 Tax=Legionella pneumophila TaxID=446 RepID=UPI0008632860|nr:hypothetical protein [Legionella pneumophila]AOU26017.1 hypothetical protein A9E77_11100 [Legionella pneumophila]HAT1781234.1 hypothetical protein [Legionella pneumophila]HAT7871347.1 hypothetical protein [Legionella pneumophila]HAT7880714.1 hypothetical protein [Legionella pneumophila]HAT7883606.1 hypothetical protein [Legionella pneumophila]